MSSEAEALHPAPAETPSDPPAPRKRRASADDPNGPVFFTKTICNLVKQFAGENSRSTPEARKLVREAVEAEGAKLCKQAYMVAQHARGSQKEGAGAVRVMPKDLDVVLGILDHESKRAKLSDLVVKERKKRVKKPKTEEGAKEEEAEKAEEKEGEAEKAEEKKEEKVQVKEEKKD
jgi:hypothetical protein